MDYTLRSIIDWLILVMMCGCMGVLSGYRHAFGSVRFRKLAKHVQGSFLLKFSCIEAYTYDPVSMQTEEELVGPCLH
jgi:hypothetical protein